MKIPDSMQRVPPVGAVQVFESAALAVVQQPVLLLAEQTVQSAQKFRTRSVCGAASAGAEADSFRDLQVVKGRAQMNKSPKYHPCFLPYRAEKHGVHLRRDIFQSTQQPQLDSQCIDILLRHFRQFNPDPSSGRQQQAWVSQRAAVTSRYGR